MDRKLSHKVIRFVPRFKCRRKPAVTRMSSSSSSVVVRLNIVKQNQFGFMPSFKFFVTAQLILDGVEERFNDSVVPAVFFWAHTLNAVLVACCTPRSL